MSDAAFEAPSLEFLAEKLPQYEFIGFIAQGGMGAVYKARQISLDRDVAIKVLPQELGENEEFRESFTKEARAMAKLNHPNLIGVYDSGDVDGMPYIVMEYIEGSSLHDSIYGRDVEPGEAVRIVKAICDGLADAHENGIIHRDIKPANILLNTKAIPKIGDFGLAHPSDSEESGLVMGTPGYTAPEVFQDPDQAGSLADIYSLGMIFHQMLTGVDPQGTEGPPSEPTGNIRLDAIWRKATQPHAGSRYGSATEMGMELQKWLDSKTGSLVLGSTVGGGGALSVKKLTSNVNTPGKATAAINTPGKGTAAINVPGKQTAGVNLPNPNTGPVAMPPANQGGAGFGMLMKVAAIGVLVAAIWFTYGLLQDNKDAISDKIAERNGTKPEEKPELPGTQPQPVDPGPIASTPTPAHQPVTPTPTPTPTPVTPVTPVTPEPAPVDPGPVAVTPTPSPAPTPTPTPTPVPEPVTPTPVVPEPVAVTPKPEDDLPPGDPALRQRATELITSARKKRDALLVKNAKSLQFDLRGHARGADKSMAEFLENFAAACNSGWLPEPNQLPTLEAKVANDYNEAREEQMDIIAKNESEIANIQKFYIPQLIKKADEASDPQIKKQLIAQANRANNLKEWVALLSPEPQRVAIAAIKGPVGGAGSFAGRWEVTSDNFTVYNCSDNGTFEVEGRGWTGTWKALSDGTISVQMGDKVPLILNKDGAGWIARPGPRKVVTFVRVGANSLTEMKQGVASGLVHAKDFIGKWDKAGGGVPMRWEADRDGTVTMYDEHGSKKPWAGVWKALPDGAVSMQIATKKPYVFVKHGRGWITRTNPSMTLTPGKW